MRVMPMVRLTIAVVAVAFGLSACSPTTYDETLATTVTIETTTTTIPSGAAADLLPVLLDEARSLSGVMIDDGDTGPVVERITALWDAARAEVLEQRPDLIDGFDASVALANKAVQFKRAADADKAARNFDVLVKAYLTD